MRWTFERRDRAAVVTTDPVEAQDRAVFADLPAGMTSSGARHAHRRCWAQLTGCSAEW